MRTRLPTHSLSHVLAKPFLTTQQNIRSGKMGAKFLIAVVKNELPVPDFRGKEFKFHKLQRQKKCHCDLSLIPTLMSVRRINYILLV